MNRSRSSAFAGSFKYQIDAMTPQCMVCDSTFIKPLYAGILQCQRCSYAFADPGLTNEELLYLYDDQFFCGGEYKDYLADKKILQKNFELRFRTLRQFLQPIRHKHLFEVGSAYGFFLDVVRDDFDSVCGIDVNERGTRYAHEHLGLNVMQGDFLQHDFGSRKFDVVCMWDTIEHLGCPDQYLKKITEHTARGALLAITTGDIGSLNARMRKSRWRLIEPPVHVHYFSSRTLTRLLGNYGFEVIYNRYCGFYRSVSNVAHNVLVLRHQKPRLFELLRQSGVTSFAFYLNLYDIMYVIARKK